MRQPPSAPIACIFIPELPSDPPVAQQQDQQPQPPPQDQQPLQPPPPLLLQQQQMQAQMQQQQGVSTSTAAAPILRMACSASTRVAGSPHLLGAPLASAGSRMPLVWHDRDAKVAVPAPTSPVCPRPRPRAPALACPLPGRCGMTLCNACGLRQAKTTGAPRRFSHAETIAHAGEEDAAREAAAEAGAGAGAHLQSRSPAARRSRQPFQRATLTREQAHARISPVRLLTLSLSLSPLSSLLLSPPLSSPIKFSPINAPPCPSPFLTPPTRHLERLPSHNRRCSSGAAP